MVDTVEEIRRLLQQKLAPKVLVVEDISHTHKGHSGWREGGGSHVRVEVEADAFAGLGRVARHKLVYGLVAEVWAGGLHALVIEARAPNEKS